MSASVIEAAYVDVEPGELLSPGASLWDDIEPISVALVPTPIESQPSAYVQVSWKDKGRGDIAAISVKALHSRDSVSIRLAWEQPSPCRSINDYNVYADACAVLFPVDGREAELSTMGSVEAPVAGWYWQAGTGEPYEITARGVGTVERSKEHQVRAANRWSADHWQVVLTRGLDLPSPHLKDTSSIPIAFAVWCGASGERAGLKSHSPEFHQLRLM